VRLCTNADATADGTVPCESGLFADGTIATLDVKDSEVAGRQVVLKPGKDFHVGQTLYVVIPAGAFNDIDPHVNTPNPMSAIEALDYKFTVEDRDMVPPLLDIFIDTTLASGKVSLLFSEAIQGVVSEALLVVDSTASTSCETDSPGWTDAKQYPCTSWKDYDCTNYDGCGSYDGCYTEAARADVRAHCPNCCQQANETFENGTAVITAVDYGGSISGNSINFLGPWMPGASYRFTFSSNASVADSIRDLAGNALVMPDRILSFDIDSDTEAPNASLAPESNASLGMHTYDLIVMEFNEAVVRGIGTCHCMRRKVPLAMKIATVAQPQWRWTFPKWCS
jgi:hypothetical protein